ncbi:T9SS type A sorting domain-containing protein, partial [bacterium]|nr:T9SS type A sorting domain-containing protein [bacterium]
PSDSLLVEMDILYVEQMYDDHVDATGNFAARLSAIEELLETIDENVEIKDNSLPTEFALHSAYPNPFNATTTIGFSLPEQMQVSLQLFDLTGRLVETLIDDRLEAGRFDAVWNADMQAAGVYFYRLQAGDFVQTRKLMLVK